MAVQHEFETTLGDELTSKDLANATYKVVETYVGLDLDGLSVVFTHRIELERTDDSLMHEVQPPQT